MWGAFQQLAMAGLISFIPSNPSSTMVGTGLPSLKLQPSSSFFLGASYNFISGDTTNPHIDAYRKGSNAMYMTACALASSTIVGYWNDSCGIFLASDLQKIDSKIDDGQPLSGSLIGYGGEIGSNDCVTDPNNANTTYKISNTSPQCDAVYVIN